MSRIGKIPVAIPSGVEVSIDGQNVTVKGPKGELSHTVVEPIRVIQGDGINLESLPRILEALKMRGLSTENLAFGMGAGLLQKVDRDTMKWAMKASQAIVGGKVRDLQRERRCIADERCDRTLAVALTAATMGMLATMGRMNAKR